jgi:hypothetical protein
MHASAWRGTVTAKGVNIMWHTLSGLPVLFLVAACAARQAPVESPGERPGSELAPAAAELRPTVHDERPGDHGAGDDTSLRRRSSYLDDPPRGGPAGRRPLASLSTRRQRKIERALRARGLHIRRCYERGKSRDPELAGKLVVAWAINRRGRVVQASVATDTLGSPAVAACVVRQIRGIRFPAPGQPQATLEHSFVFR